MHVTHLRLARFAPFQIDPDKLVMMGPPESDSHYQVRLRPQHRLVFRDRSGRRLVQQVIGITPLSLALTADVSDPHCCVELRI